MASGIQCTLQAASELSQALDAARIRHLAVGSVAGVVYQRMRDTHDIDLLADITARNARQFLTVLAPISDIEPHIMTIALDNLRLHNAGQGDPRSLPSLNVEHLATGLRLDIFLLMDNEYQRETLQRRQRVTTAGGPIWVASVEDTLIAKLRWAQINNDQFTDTGWADAVILFAENWNRADQRYVRRWVAALGLDALLDSVLRGERPRGPEQAEQQRLF